MESGASIRSFAARITGPVYALVNNAGGQFHGPTAFTAEGIERTLALNHLGPLRLTYALLDRLGGGTVLNIGSGTHNPRDRGARLFGFRGGRFTSVAALARVRRMLPMLVKPRWIVMRQASSSSWPRPSNSQGVTRTSDS